MGAQGLPNTQWRREPKWLLFMEHPQGQRTTSPFSGLKGREMKQGQGQVASDFEKFLFIPLVRGFGPHLVVLGAYF